MNCVCTFLACISVAGFGMKFQLNYLHRKLFECLKTVYMQSPAKASIPSLRWNIPGA